MALPMPRDAPVTTHTPVSTAGGREGKGKGRLGWEGLKSGKKASARNGRRSTVAEKLSPTSHPAPPQSALTLQGLGRGGAGRPAAALAGAVEEAHKGARGLHVPCTHSGTSRGSAQTRIAGLLNLLPQPGAPLTHGARRLQRLGHASARELHSGGGHGEAKGGALGVVRQGVREHRAWFYLIRWRQVVLFSPPSASFSRHPEPEELAESFRDTP